MLNEDTHLEFEIRGVDAELRTVSGIAMPYNDASEGVAGYTEMFQRGAFADAEVGTPVYYNHDWFDREAKKENTSVTPIGSITEIREEDDGLHIVASLASTAKAQEIYTLVREGHLKSFSAGFQALKSTTVDGVVVRTKALLKEVSILPKGAYRKAAVAEVRAAESNNTKENEIMSNDTENSEVVELREAVNDLERKVAMGFSVNETPEVAPQFRSGGDFLKALYNRDEQTMTQLRAYTGMTTADTIVKDSWQGRALDVVEKERVLTNLFSKSPLSKPVKRVEFPKRKPVAVTGTVELQGHPTATTTSIEGADLVNIRIDIEEDFATVNTYGAWSEVTRQTIEMGDVAFLDALLMVQAQEYAARTEKVVRDALAAATGTGTVTLTADNAQSWIRLILAARRSVKTNGRTQAAFALVGGDVYDRLATLVDTTGRPLFDLNGDGSNTVGSVGLVGQTGALAGLPLVLDDAAAANSFIVAGTNALTSYEVTGSPVRLQDENIINLTKAFSLYGYFGVGVGNPSAIVKADVDLV